MSDQLPEHTVSSTSSDRLNKVLIYARQRLKGDKNVSKSLKDINSVQEENYTGSNRRRSHRLSMPFRIEMKNHIDGVKQREHSTLINFGATGVLFLCKGNHRIGTALDLKIYGPQSSLFHVFRDGELSGAGEVVFMNGGRVVRLESGSDQNADSLFAVEFFGPCRISKLKAS